MAEIYVTSTADSGAGSLRQAIADAQDGDVILFDSDVFPAGQTTSILLSSYITVNKSISIYGGFNDGNGGYTSGATITRYVVREVEGVETEVVVDDDNPAQEGEIVLMHVATRVALDGQATQDPNAEGDWDGWSGSRVLVCSAGGIAVGLHGVELKNGRSAATESGPLLYFSPSDVSAISISDCKFSGGVNSAGIAGGAVFRTKSIVNATRVEITKCRAKGSCGALYLVGSTISTLTDFCITDCSATSGGAVQTANTSQNNLTNCVISGCSVKTNGGGVNSLSTSQNTLSDCTISDCSAANGGGVNSSDTSHNTLSDCTISGCSVTNGGGGLYSANTSQNTLTDCNISGCSAANGGGLCSYSTSQNTLNDCNISGCSATNNGGGLCSYSTSQNTLTDCNISGCSANYGGGLFFTSTSQNTLTGCVITGCSAINGGGGEFADKSIAELSNCIFTNCTATQDGGGLFIYNTPHVTLNACIFDVTSSVYFVSSAFITVSGGITVIARIKRAAVAKSEVITIADDAALTLTGTASIGAATFTSEGRGYLAVDAGIDVSAATLTNVVLCAYGADVSSFAEVDGVLEWEAANPTTTVLIERADGDSWTTVTQTAGESMTLYLPPSDTVRLFDGVQFFTAQAPSQRTYYYIGGAEGSFTSAADWSLRRGGVAITEPPVVAGQRFIVGDISSGE